MHYSDCEHYTKNLLLAAFMIVATAVPSYAATPSDAFQRAEHLGEMIEILLESDLNEKKLEADPAKNASRPRHVLRYATRVFEEIQFLRVLNGKSAQPLPKIDASEIKPNDVVEVLEAAIASLRDLEDVYQVELDFTPPKVAENKKPDDVLSRLRAVAKSLFKLGTPKILPNDVYRVVLGIKEQTDTLLSRRGIVNTTTAPSVEKASPADAMTEALQLFDDLEQITASQSDLALPGGVARPPVPAQNTTVTPTDVFLAAQYALADLYSLNVSLGYDKPLKLPPPQSGKNPANVKNTLAQARLNIQALAQKN